MGGGWGAAAFCAAHGFNPPCLVCEAGGGKHLRLRDSCSLGSCSLCGGVVGSQSHSGTLIPPLFHVCRCDSYFRDPSPYFSAP